MPGFSLSDYGTDSLPVNADNYNFLQTFANNNNLPFQWNPNISEQDNWANPGTGTWSQDTLKAFEPYSFYNGGYDENSNPLTSVYQGSNNLFTGRSGSHSSLYDTLMPAVIGLGIGAAGGGALASGFGGGTTGAIASGATMGGINAAMNDQNIAQGALLGGAGAGLANGVDAAKYAGVTNPTYAGAINGAVGGGISSGLKGDSVASGAAQGGIMGGIGSYFKGFADSLTQPSLASLQGSGGDMSGVTDVTGSSYDTEAPNYRYSNTLGNTDSFQLTPQTTEASPMKTIQGLLPSGEQLGNFAANNATNLLSTLYGVYNNRKQSNLLNQQLNSLNGLFGANSPYAQELRAKMGAQAAARGQRSNSAATDRAYAAAMAEKQASMAPSLYQLLQGKQTLQNSLGSSLIGSIGNMKGLKDLFSGGAVAPNMYQQYYGGNP